MVYGNLNKQHANCMYVAVCIIIMGRLTIKPAQGINRI